MNVPGKELLPLLALTTSPACFPELDPKETIEDPCGITVGREAATVLMDLELGDGAHYTSGEVTDGEGELTESFNCISDENGACETGLATSCDDQFWKVWLREGISSVACTWNADLVDAEGLPQCNLSENTQEDGAHSAIDFPQYIEVDGNY